MRLFLLNILIELHIFKLNTLHHSRIVGMVIGRPQERLRWNFNHKLDVLFTCSYMLFVVLVTRVGSLTNCVLCWARSPALEHFKITSKTTLALSLLVIDVNLCTSLWRWVDHVWLIILVFGCKGWWISQILENWIVGIRFKILPLTCLWAWALFRFLCRACALLVNNFTNEGFVEMDKLLLFWN